MQVIADLQIHSRFSRAVSREMTIPNISRWAEKKGVGLIATGDWTHPIWYREILASLEEVEEGIYQVKGENKKSSTKFLLSTEISSIYSQGGKTRRIHTLVFAPSIATVEKINKEFLRRGANLGSDGRPIVGWPARAVSEIVLNVDPKSLIIPAHAWTPHFALFGSESGFDSITECFAEQAKYIYAVETGLSSDPAMNWRISELDNRSIVSFSDAHSLPKIGREATVFEIDGKEDFQFFDIRNAIVQESPFSRIAYTIEFYPEEGKYHYTGHRKCNVVHSPKETRKLGSICPVCGKSLTVGVLARVEHLASRDVETSSTIDKLGVRWIEDPRGVRKPYVMMVPLLEILAEALASGPTSQKVQLQYERLTQALGGEFGVLLKTPIIEIEKLSGPKIAEAIRKTRSGDIYIEPGYDGVFGKVKIWEGESKGSLTITQESLF